MSRWRAAVPLVVVLLSPPVMLYHLWANPVSAGEDDVIAYYPLRKLVGQAIARGEFPVRDSLAGGGAPLAADPQAAVMHPSTWLFAVLPAKRAYAMSIYMAFWLAGGGMYFYLRRLGPAGGRLARPAATFGAVAFMFCGFMVGHRVHLPMIHAAGALPWILWGIEVMRAQAVSDRPDGRAGGGEEGRNESAAAKTFGVVAPAIFLAIASGSWPTVINMAIISAVYLALRGRPLLKTLGVMIAAAAVATAVAAPQILATVELMRQTTRQQIGLATANENSFFPTEIVHALFPMLMGNRTPNFFAQQWWGPWDLCEMLGYVGLVTLVLAGASIRRLHRKKPDDKAVSDFGFRAWDLTLLVRTWTWILIGAGVWMLGYYCWPVAWVIHKIPIINIVRCPARMVLAADFALAVLAAIAIHAAIAGWFAGCRALERTIRRTATFVLPLAMLAMLGMIAWIAYFVYSQDFWQFFKDGRQAAAREALRLGNPAIWVQFALAAGTIVIVRLWIRSPARRASLLVALLLADLYFIAGFVDRPAAYIVAPDPEISPAADWIKAYAPGEPFRVYGLGRTYFDRPAELALPLACEVNGLVSIANYGPFQSPANAQLLGFNTAGYNRDWTSLIRRNYLLSAYGVRYIVAADMEFRRVIESVCIPSGPAPPDGPNLLGEDWQLNRASMKEIEVPGGPPEKSLRLVTPLFWRPSEASQPVAVEPETVYRISLDACGPEGGAANYLRAEIPGLYEDQPFADWDKTGLSIRAEEMGASDSSGGAWRRFEWKFRTPRTVPADARFRLYTLSERLIEVRNVAMCRSTEDRPIDPSGRLKPGERVYAKRIELEAMNFLDPAVAIYENLLCPPANQRPAMDTDISPQRIEWLKWKYPLDAAAPLASVPDIWLHARGGVWRAVLYVSLPALCLYAAVIVVGTVISRRRRIAW
ncbi:MAG: hypothetical protein ACE15C_11240 [Phycisphaerae bacterium]